VLLAVSILLALASAATTFLFTPAPQLGFIGPFSGPKTAIGSSGYCGTLLAVEECNASGGIRGRNVRLLARDDHHSPQAALQNLTELGRANVFAVVGPMTNDIAVAVAPALKSSNVVLLSPTVSDDDLSSRSEFFARIYPGTKDMMQVMADYLVGRRGLRNICIVTDAGDPQFSGECAEQFRAAATARGAAIAATVQVQPGQSSSVLDVAHQIVATSPDAILALLDAGDTGMLCQQLRKIGCKLPVATTESPATADLFITGSSAVEGVVLLQTIDSGFPSERFRLFSERYRSRFGRDCDFAAVHAYDAARILLRAMVQASNAAELRQALSSMRFFDGVQGRMRFDENGDVRRELYIVQARNGRFVPVE
jgi:branched-chain amino acid transport system substrate-binding protein